MSRRDHRFQILLDELRRQINSSFVHGETLPSQRDLALMHGVGPTTIHRALLTLSSEGSLKVVPRVGWRKIDRESAHRAGKRESITIGIMSRRSAEEWPRFDIPGAAEGSAPAWNQNRRTAQSARLSPTAQP